MISISSLTVSNLFVDFQTLVIKLAESNRTTKTIEPHIQTFEIASVEPPYATIATKVVIPTTMAICILSIIGNFNKGEYAPIFCII